MAGCIVTHAGKPGILGLWVCRPTTVGVANRFPSSNSSMVNICILGYSLPHSSIVPASAMKRLKLRSFTAPDGSRSAGRSDA